MTHRYGDGAVPTGDRLSDLGSPICRCSSVKCPSLIFIPLPDSVTSTHPTHPPVPSLLHLSSFKHPVYSHTSTGGQRTGDSVWISAGPYRSGGWLLRAERVKIVDALRHATVSCGMEGYVKVSSLIWAPVFLPVWRAKKPQLCPLYVFACRLSCGMSRCRPFSNDTAYYGCMCFWRYMSRVRH